MTAQCTGITNKSCPPDIIDSSSKKTKMAFEQWDSSCWNSRNSKWAQGDVMASSSPQVPHWILSSLGELCTQWPNKCDRHLPRFKPPHSKWRAPSHPQLRYRCYVTAPHISYPFPPSREMRGCARRKPCVGYRQLEQVGDETSHPRGESESGGEAGWLEGHAGTCHLFKRAFHLKPRINSSFWNLVFLHLNLTQENLRTRTFKRAIAGGRRHSRERAHCTHCISHRRQRGYCAWEEAHRLSWKRVRLWRRDESKNAENKNWDQK